MPTPSLGALPVLLPAALAAGYAAWYALACAEFPFADCRRCHGHGWLTTRTGRRGRPCPRCDGSRRRVRLGRRLYEFLRREYSDGNPDHPTTPTNRSDRGRSTR